MYSIAHALLICVPTLLSRPNGEAMKLMISRLLVVIVVLSQTVFAQSPLAARIERVERGLLPATPIKGEPGWTIQERMKHYRVPGVSIAVINDYKVEWAKSYGVKDV